MTARRIALWALAAAFVALAAASTAVVLDALRPT